MEFKVLETENELKQIAEAVEPHIIFKHNTTCPISKSMRQKFEQEAHMLPDATPVYILDLLSHRNISDAIADTFEVTHESPQLLVVSGGKCVFHQSLYNISAQEVAEAVVEAGN